MCTILPYERIKNQLSRALHVEQGETSPTLALCHMSEMPHSMWNDGSGFKITSYRYLIAQYQIIDQSIDPIKISMIK